VEKNGAGLGGVRRRPQREIMLGSRSDTLPRLLGKKWETDSL
jgi:hypothetical protein